MSFVSYIREALQDACNGENYLCKKKNYQYEVDIDISANTRTRHEMRRCDGS